MVIRRDVASTSGFRLQLSTHAAKARTIPGEKSLSRIHSPREHVITRPEQGKCRASEFDCG
jgi:hypothetical protein